jgi:hypothetical protein
MEMLHLVRTIELKASEVSTGLLTELLSGNGKGEVILFEPPTSEHISARTIFDPITALAPATDCRTYAIGYVSTP